MRSVYFADCNAYHGRGISLPKDLCVSGPNLDQVQITTALRLWTKWNKDTSGKMDGPFHKYLWDHGIRLDFAAHEKQQQVLDCYGIEIPYDVSICMPNLTISKCRQVLKRFAATLQKDIPEEEQEKRKAELQNYTALHHVRLLKLDHSEKRVRPLRQ